MAISFIAACRQYFGLKTDQKLTEFAAEMKELTDKDRAELQPLLAQALKTEVTIP